MQTIVIYHDYMGKEIDKNGSNCDVYVQGDTIIFKNEEFHVNGITYDEDQGIKYVRAYSPNTL